MINRIKIMSLALFSLLPTATLLATETQPKVKQKISPYLLKFHKKLNPEDLENLDSGTNRDENLQGQPVDEKGCLLDKHKFAAYSLPIEEELTFKELKKDIVDKLNDSNTKRIRKEKGLKQDQELNDEEKLAIFIATIDYIHLYVVANQERQEGPYYLSVKENDKVPAGSKIHILVNDIDIKNVESGLKGLKKGWGTGTIVGVILGGAAVIGAAGGAIYYALQPKAPVKKEPKEEQKEEQNEEKLETAPKKTEVA